ncbi:DUF6466 family protein [Alloscardovia criceti]|uniref:DUF6466 family protein n=1 Tax=Alloscardovia criceti TaxID=356828 RepID=UPI0003643EB6|nr:DUF6466 family protein [Alloscardovia criceti]
MNALEQKLSTHTRSPRDSDLHRGSLTLRIVLIVAAVFGTLIGLYLSMNLIVAQMYNSATTQLNNSIAEYSQTDPDLQALADQQIATDQQFADVTSVSWMLVPSLSSSAQHNKEVSAALTQQIQDDLNQTSSQSASASASSSSSSDSSSSSSSSNSDESSVDSDTQERMQTLLDNNTNVENNYEAQAPKTTTKKPW